MTTHAHPEAAILCKCREMILLLNVHLNHFPKHEKYGLCQSIRQAAYDVYALLAECQKRYHNKTSLNSILGNALRTSSHAHMCRRIRDERPELIYHIPSARNRHANP